MKYTTATEHQPRRTTAPTKMGYTITQTVRFCEKTSNFICQQVIHYGIFHKIYLTHILYCFRCVRILCVCAYLYVCDMHVQIKFSLVGERRRCRIRWKRKLKITKQRFVYILLYTQRRRHQKREREKENEEYTRTQQIANINGNDLI